MDQRAIELYKQASEFAYSTIEQKFWNTAAFQGAVTGKFAELIVRECARVAFDDWCEGTNESSSEMAILKHFGVEQC